MANDINFRSSNKWFITANRTSDDEYPFLDDEGSFWEDDDGFAWEDAGDSNGQGFTDLCSKNKQCKKCPTCWKEQGFCTKCGDEGMFISLQLTCRNGHGRIFG